MPTYRVRRATRSDAHAIVKFNAAMALETESLKLDEGVLEKGVHAVFDDDKIEALYFVAEEEQEDEREDRPPSPFSPPSCSSSAVVACAMVTFEWSDWRNAPCWWLQSVYCDPRHRRRGVFSQMYSAVREAARGARACGLRLYAETGNGAAHEVYGRLGMRTGHYQVFEDMF